jgi:mono/diheme cytochrome c family protein
MTSFSTLPCAATLWLVAALTAHVFFYIGHAQAQNKELVTKGQYIFAIAGGCACHTVPKQTPHAGARPFPIPFGTVYSTNITQDKETGLGAWSDQQILDAMIKGIRRDGSRILPVMPYEKYSGIAEEDLQALLAFLRTLKPVRKATPELKTRVPFMRSAGSFVYLNLFGRFSTRPRQAPKTGVDRGRYLVDHVSLCGDCHTPRNSLGVPQQSFYMAGASQDIGPLGEAVANITPDPETGIGNWSREEIAELLRTGTKPDLDNVQGLMDEVIQGTTHGYKGMTKEDALAIADYLKSIPPIKNKIQ